MFFIVFLTCFIITTPFCINASEEKNHLQELPKEIIGHICSYLDNRSLGALRVTSDSIDNLLSDPKVLATSVKNNERELEFKSYNDFIRKFKKGLHTKNFVLNFEKKEDLILFLRNVNSQKVAISLEFKGTFLYALSADFLLKNLSKYKNLKSIDLSVRMNGLSDENIKQLAPALAKLSELETLRLKNVTDNLDRISFEGLELLAPVLMEMKKLKEFSIGGRFDKNSALLLAQVLPTLDNIEHLAFTSCSLDAECANTVVSSLRKTKKLEALYLGSNYLTDYNNEEDFEEFAISLGQLQNLKELYLHRNNLGSYRMGVIFSQICHMQNRLKAIEIAGNRIEDEGLMQLSCFIKTCSNLTYLGLSINNLTYKSAPVLASMLNSLKKIEQLALGGNESLCKDFSQLAPALSNLKFLKKLWLLGTGLLEFENKNNWIILANLIEKELINLKMLSISISYLPSNYSELINLIAPSLYNSSTLEELYVRGFPIKFFDEKQFKNKNIQISCWNLMSEII